MPTPLSSSQAAQRPNVEIPPSSNIVAVRVIDSTTRIHMPVGSMFEPVIKGHTKLASPSYSFVIENERLGKKVLFDLGTQKRWTEQAPEIVSMIDEFGWDVQVEKGVADILEEHGFSLAAIDAIIWSHSHWDHLGDPTTFPNSTGLVIGPGFLEENFSDGEPYPDSGIKKEYCENRELREISAPQFDLDIAGFPAFDYFGDGSFYLLDSPGHAVGHMSALARTTSNPDTFIFMGADIASHPGEFRPSTYVPLPAHISPMYQKVHPRGRSDTPFYRIGKWPDGESCADDLPAALESHRKLQLIDAQVAQVFVILAHDEDVKDVIDLFPESANCWKELGWADKVRWMFLSDFLPPETI